MSRSRILGLIAATTLLRLAFAATTGLGVDESYMVAAGRVLSLGYFDHPPASWWLSWAAAHLFGTESPLVVRLPFILLFAASQWLMALMAEFIADRQAAFWAVAALNLSPVFGLTTGTWVLPDGPLDAALLLAAWCLLHATEDSGRPALPWWCGAGVGAGLALFSKYSAILTISGVFGWLALTTEGRQWLRRPGPYVAALLAATVFAPVLAWNATHGWASFAFQGDRAGGLRFAPFSPIVTLAGEALFVLPWFWLPMMAALCASFRRKPARPECLLGWLAVPPIITFALISAWSSHRILYHWAAPGYLMLFPLMGRMVAIHAGSLWLRRGLGATAGLLLLSATLIACQTQFDMLGGVLAPLGPKDPTIEAVDWTSLRTDLRSRGLLGANAVVAALNWRDAGKIGYGVGQDIPILCLNEDARQFRFAAPLTKYAGRTVIVLSVSDPSRTREMAASWFTDVARLPDASIRLEGRKLRTVTVLLGQSLQPR